MRTSSFRRAGLLALAVGATVGLSACAGGAGSAAPASSAPADAATRVALSYPGGILVLDGDTLETLGDMPSEEFTRLNPAGDGRHVMVTTSAGFQVLDAGASGVEPELTDLVFEASKPGHVVTHGGTTVLYADGTSDSTIFDSDALLASTDSLPAVQTVPGVEAHHGVSIVLEDGTFLTTVGTADGRTGVVAKDAAGSTIAESADCPGVHGEGTAKDEVVVFGCENGALVFDDGAFTKLTAPDQPYGRMGNAYVSENSALVVGDYKDDRDAEGYLLHRVALIDTAAKTQRVIDMPEGAEYTFRDVARGPGELAYVLSSDGAIHVLDPATGEFTDAFPVIDAWEGPVEWQDAHPAIKVSGDIAYVTEPAKNTVHAVDLTTGEVVKSVTLAQTPNEIALTK
ncbi:zinc metallochaperone AztD [Microbacterium sp. KSW4-17]|uniref:Zinc metallochaperone AztD n=1 Tax=Microbacterium galbum TaxID=3075994 RepID=A0ABU3T948_9MICO|nr:zinc metallochaperone AztD [Microbacterium sp. KSW4-17]MDU0367888.1 zinc metallochaperone AztD [Microbacterium sp. KSW4-17]